MYHKNPFKDTRDPYYYRSRKNNFSLAFVKTTHLTYAKRRHLGAAGHDLVEATKAFAKSMFPVSI